MFCFQCEQTAKGKGCEVIGVCGKDETTADLQDLLVYALKGLSQVSLKAREKGITDRDTERFMLAALFSTLTNVNFDPDRLLGLIKETLKRRDELRQKIGEEFTSDAATFELPATMDEIIEKAKKVGVKSDPTIDPDILSLRETLVYGLKGVAAYAHHASELGKEDDYVFEFVERGLAATVNAMEKGLEEWVDLVLECGKANFKAMELLDAANTGTYGHPVPTEVPLGHKKGKAILVSGHDLQHLDAILKQSEGKGIYVYTHGEMLPCHGYPELKKYPHFYGHYGTAWQNQQKEFPAFPGPIVMTTNCIQKPGDTYMDHIFTSGVVAWPGVKHIEGLDFTPVIEKALEMPGFQEDEDKGSVMVGFARNAILGVADKVIEAVKSGAIKHFFLVAGCDGAKPGRNYYTKFVELVPKDCVVLTLACGKFRFFDKKLGDIGGIPRLLDVGQCNDAYSAIEIAVALSKAFGCDVNELPLSMVLSWYEQKAVAILLTLLYLGIKNMRLGPSLPAFLSENVLNFLVEKYNIKPIGTPEEDLKEILGA